MTNTLTFHEGEDPDNPCILLPRYRAVGRTAPNGKRYTAVTKKNEEDLVEVRSIITKYKDKTTVTPDLLSPKNSDFTDGAAIGASFGTSLTESMTQGALALKHGGHEKVLDETAYLRAPMDCTLSEEGKWIVLKAKSGKKKLIYPRPDNFVNTGETEFKEGELIGAAYRSMSPINKVNSLVKLFHAAPSSGHRYYEKDNVIISDCYALEEGVIHYAESKSGKIEVTIGNRQYDYNPNVMYLYPDGTKIKKRQRFCSGLVNIDHVSMELGDNVRETYLIFRKQFYELQEKDFKKDGYLGDHAMQEELVELLFASLININVNINTKAVENVKYLGTVSGTLNNDSFYTVLSYGHSPKTIAKALRGEIHMADDTMSETVLGLLLNNQLDQ